MPAWRYLPSNLKFFNSTTPNASILQYRHICVNIDSAPTLQKAPHTARLGALCAGLMPF